MLNWATASDLDRVDQHRRNDEWVASLWQADDAKLLKLDAESRFTTSSNGHNGHKLRMTKPFVAYDNQRHRLLGLLEGSPIFAVEALTEGEVYDLRAVGHELTDNERDIAAAASAITQWHRISQFCPACGSATEVVNGGFARRCQAEGREIFPRTDPAVIVAVVDDHDRLLLGGQPAWGTRISVLAGFVEAGESLEQTIHREIGEEADITLSETVYFGSQPWPFPRSLMVGYFARASSFDICVAADELEHADWYTRADLDRQLAEEEVGLPGRSSIARRLIEAWREDRAPL